MERKDERYLTEQLSAIGARVAKNMIFRELERNINNLSAYENRLNILRKEVEDYESKIAERVARYIIRKGIKAIVEFLRADEKTSLEIYMKYRNEVVNNPQYKEYDEEIRRKSEEIKKLEERISFIRRLSQIITLEDIRRYSYDEEIRRNIIKKLEETARNQEE